MTDNIIEAQNYEDAYQYLQFKQRRRIDNLLLGTHTASALLPLSLPLVFWLYAQHAYAVLGHYPKPHIDSNERIFLAPMYDNLVGFAFALSGASALICLLVFLMLCIRKAGRRSFYSLVFFVTVWMTVFAMEVNDSTRFSSWWLD